MLLRRITWCFLLLGASISNALGQQYPYIYYNPKDGLVNSRVRAMMQDSKGRLFFMTPNGLSVYDGVRFTNYKTEQGLPNPMVNDMLEVGTDSFLLATNTGALNAWVRGSIVTVSTDNSSPVINKFFRNAKNEIFLATDSGLYSFTGKKFIRLPIPDTAYKRNPLTLDDVQQVGNKLILKGTLDMSCPGGVYIYDLSKRKLDTFVTKPFHSVIQLQKQNALICFYDDKLIVYDLSAISRGKLVRIPIPATFKSLQGRFVFNSRLDQQGNLWCAEAKSVDRIDSLGNVFSLNGRTGLAFNNLKDVYIDKENIVWIITDGSGVIKLVNNNLEIVTSLYQTFSSGINSLYANPQTDTTWLYNFDDREIFGSFPKGIIRYAIDTPIFALNIIAHPKGFYFIAPYAIYSADRSRKGNEKLHIRKVYSCTGELNFEKAICDDDGTIFIPGHYVLAWKENKISFSLPLPYFTDQLAIDKHHQLWAAVRNGDLLCFSIHQEDPNHLLTLKHNYRSVIPFIGPRSLTVDSSDQVWIGTRYDGLWCFRFQDTLLAGQFHFTTKDGLTDNFISYLNTSRTNTIWAGSQNGVDKISFINGKFKVEGVTRSNNVFEFVRAISVSKDHKVWVRGASGSVMRINDGQVAEPNHFKPNLRINSLKTSDTTYQLPKDQQVFTYNQNNLLFEVAAPTFIDEKQVLFSYLLNGSTNNKWSPPSSQGNFNFINLPPGKYALQVRATFPVPDYEPEFLTYHFTIFPPWWETLWFKVLALIGAIAAILFLVRQYVSRKLERQRIAMEKMQAIEKERTRIASDMHDDLGAGLSTIRFLGEKMNRKVSDDSDKNDIQKIVLNSNELVQKMNEIIWAMNEKNDSLEDLLFYTRSYVVEYCEENNLQCNINLPELLPEIFVSGEIRRNIFLIVKESLHNIVKHARASKVNILFDVQNNLRVSISDNGRGLQKESNWKSGNGLLNMQKRIHVLGGQMHTSNGNGFTVTFDVPLH